MTDLKAVYDSLDDIPESVEDFRSLFTERDGRYELSGLPGVKTTADIERLQRNLSLERDSHKQTKERFRPFAELDPEEVFAKLDKLPELEAAASGKLDEAGIEEIASRRVEGAVRSKVAPLERKLKDAATELEALREQHAVLSQERAARQRSDALRPLLAKAGVLPQHYEDVELYAERHLEQAEDGNWVTRDGVGVTPGFQTQEWLAEMLEKRPGWLPANVGGGSRGSGSQVSGNNPFSKSNWNVTAQGALIQTKGREYAERMAAAAGTKVGGSRPRE